MESKEGDDFAENDAKVLDNKVPFVGAIGDMDDEKVPPSVVKLFFQRSSYLSSMNSGEKYIKSQDTVIVEEVQEIGG